MPLKDCSNSVRVTPRSVCVPSRDDIQLQLIKTFPEDLQSLYLSLQSNLQDTVVQLTSAIEYVETVKQTIPEHIAKYLQDCLHQQLDRSVRSQKLACAVVLKEAVKHYLTSL